MDKYQKAALVDILKMLGIGLGIGVILNLALSVLTTAQFVGIAAVLLLGYTGYNLFKIRVDQHRTLDELKNRSK